MYISYSVGYIAVQTSNDLQIDFSLQTDRAAQITQSTLYCVCMCVRQCPLYVCIAGAVRRDSATAPSDSNQDNVYFDHLVTGTPQTSAMPTPHPSVPPTSTGGGDDVYFDHLVTGEPPQPHPVPRRMTTGQVSYACRCTC